MKLRLLFSAALLSGCAGASAEVLLRDATVYAQPDPAASVLRVLPAGSVPTPALAPAVPAPEGWLAVELAGPHEVYVENKHVGKTLEIKPGSALRLRPEASAPAVATMEATDKTDLAGLAGPRRDWSHYRIDKPIIGYLKVPAIRAPAPAPAATAVSSGPAVNPDSGHALMPRFFEGRFAATENFLTYRHPYKYQLLDSFGNRFAYLDVSRLLMTEDLSRYIDRVVVVYGTARTINEKGTKRVIDIENLRLR